MEDKTKFYSYPKRSIFFTHILPFWFISFNTLIIFSVCLVVFIFKIMNHTINIFDIIFSFLALVFVTGIFWIIRYIYGSVKPVGIDRDCIHYRFTKTKWINIIGAEERATKSNKKVIVIKTAKHNPFYKYIIVNSSISDYENLKKEIKNMLQQRKQ